MIKKGVFFGIFHSPTRIGHLGRHCTIGNASVLVNWEMPLDKLTLLLEDNQFDRKHLFKFDRVTASELETGISIVLASSNIK